MNKLTLGIISTLRIHQYIKNLFVYAALFFSFFIWSFDSFFKVSFAFVSFCLIASSIYIINDLFDKKEDRSHPTKKNRAIASGIFGTKLAIFVSLLLLSLSLIISISPFILGIIDNINLLYIIIFYFILNLAYSSYLKHIVILDIFIIASGFVVRLFAGSVMIDVKLSSWMIIITFLLALFLALAKRRNDIFLSINSKSNKKIRKNIDGYNFEFINTSMAIMSSIVVISYILYTTSKEVTGNMGSDNLYITSIFVLLGMMRYLKITIVDEQSGNPSKVILKDKPLQLIIMCYLLCFFCLVVVF